MGFPTDVFSMYNITSHREYLGKLHMYVYRWMAATSCVVYYLTVGNNWIKVNKSFDSYV